MNKKAFNHKINQTNLHERRLAVAVTSWTESPNGSCSVTMIVTLLHLYVYRFIITLSTRHATRAKNSSKSICKVVRSSQRQFSIERSKEPTLWRWRRETVHHRHVPTVTLNPIQVC